MFYFMNVVRPFVNYEIFCELCDRMRFEVDCAKSHHRIISEGLKCFNFGHGKGHGKSWDFKIVKDYKPCTTEK